MDRCIPLKHKLDYYDRDKGCSLLQTRTDIEILTDNGSDIIVLQQKCQHGTLRNNMAHNVNCLRYCLSIQDING